jgi:hypothetical protein
MICYNSEEDRAIARGLGLPYARNLQQLLACLRTPQRHLDQDTIRENDEGRLLLGAGDFEPFRLEDGEQAILFCCLCRGKGHISPAL